MYRTGSHLHLGFIALLILAVTLTTACSRDVQTEPREAEPVTGAETGHVSSAGEPASTPQDQEDEIDRKYRVAAEQRKQKAAELVKEAREHYYRGENEKALTVLSHALVLDKTNKDAAVLMNQIEAAFDQRQGAIQDQSRREYHLRLLKLEQAKIRAGTLIRQGEIAMDTGDFAEAINLFQDALNIIQHGPYGVDITLDEAGIENRLKDARERLKKQELEVTRSAAKEARLLKQQEEAVAVERKETRLKRLLHSANRYFQMAKYDEAEKHLDFVLKLADPESRYADEANSLIQIIRESRHDQNSRLNRKNMAEQWKRIFEDLKLSTLLPKAVIEFPRDWELTIGKRKPATLAQAARIETEEDKIIKRKLESTMVQLAFEDDTEFAAVIDHFHKLTNINFIPSKGVHEKLSEGSTLNGINTKLPLKNALELVLDMVGTLKYKVEDGIIHIIMPEEAKADTYLDFYTVKDLVNPIRDFPGPEINLNPSGAEYDEEMEGGEEGYNQNFDPDRLTDVIKGNIAKDTWEEDPTSYSAQIRNGLLIVKHTNEVHGQIQKLLSGLRKSATTMVALEARFIMVEDNFLEDIGVDFRGLGDHSQGVGLAGQGTKATIDDFGTSGAPGGSGTAENPAGPGTNTNAGIFFNDNSDGDIRARTENLYDSLLGNPQVLTGSGGLSFQLTYLDDTEVELILRAVRKSERINMVTAPRITLFNTQRANVTVLNQVAYIRDYDAEIAQAAAIVEPVVDVIQDGVVMDVRPIVSSDRRYITMDLRPTVAVLSRPIPQFTASVATGTPVTIELPRLEVQRVRTTVTIPDNATVLLGGLKFSEERDLYSGIPWLSKLPLINFLTSRRGKYINRRNLLILLKAKIIIPDEVAPGIAVDN